MTPMEAQAYEQARVLWKQLKEAANPITMLAASRTDAYAQGRRAGLEEAAKYADDQAEISSGIVASVYMIVADWCGQAAQEEGA